MFFLINALCVGTIYRIDFWKDEQHSEYIMMRILFKHY